MTMALDTLSSMAALTRLPHESSSSSSSSFIKTTNNKSSSLSTQQQQQQQQSPPSSGQSQRSVSFDFVEQVFTIENLKELSKSKKKKLWLTNDEFQAGKVECQGSLNSINQSPENATIFSYRGLEMVDPEATAKRHRHNTDAVSVVMLEQKEQRWKEEKNGSYNPSKAIRDAYKKVVIDSRREALENAYIDAKAVKEYISTTHEELEREQILSKQGRKGRFVVKKRRSFVNFLNQKRTTASSSTCSSTVKSY